MEFEQLKQIYVRNLKRFRKDARMSQMQLGLRCNTAASYIGEIEIGRKFPSLKMMARIADALQISPHLFLLDGSGQTRAEFPRPIATAYIKRRLAEQLTLQVNSTIQRVLRKF
ncbi:MAG: helix-turn-helix domain-containing protein [Candidatus Margulisbacteria bacterium]|jgi:transcriptional regulator with XRE-family HTH domain|nr:helix-turn-helix domain-containing protein [Candidatus Margulisiibacteriota bacterium]